MSSSEYYPTVHGITIDNANNSAVSVRDRFKNKTKAESVDFQRVLNNYAIQTFLCRIAKNQYRSNLLLKGSWLLVAWHGQLHRQTKIGPALINKQFQRGQINWPSRISLQELTVDSDL